MILFRQARIRRIERRIEYHVTKAETTRRLFSQSSEIPRHYLDVIIESLSEVAALRKRLAQLQGS